MSAKKFPLSGKSALITGAASRLGRAMALAVAAEGANVVVHYHRSADAAEATAEEIRAVGASAWTLQADLRQTNQVEALMPRAIEAAGGIDILINNASIFQAGAMMHVTVEEITENIQVHALAPLTLSRALAEQGRRGHIINLLDSRVTDYDRNHAAYHLSKRMLLTLTRMLALELAPRIAVNGVAPGLILPPAGKDETYLRDLAHTNPMNRHGDAQDVTDAILYLLKSRFVTGQVLFVDGGRHMRGPLYD